MERRASPTTTRDLFLLRMHRSLTVAARIGAATVSERFGLLPLQRFTTVNVTAEGYSGE